MRYLGLDLGTKSLGIALSDKSNTIASGLKTIKYNEDDYDKMVDDVVKLVDEYQITHIVLGLPKNMDNSLGFASNRSIEFEKKIKEKIDVNVILMDERLTTVLAQNVLIKADMSRKKRKNVVDTVAATIILNDYLNMRRNLNE